MVRRPNSVMLLVQEVFGTSDECDLDYVHAMFIKVLDEKIAGRERTRMAKRVVETRADLDPTDPRRMTDRQRPAGDLM